MRTIAIVAVLLVLLELSDPGAIGSLMILALPFVFLRGVWLFAGDLRQLGRTRR
jgi:hypothetical protein